MRVGATTCEGQHHRYWNEDNVLAQWNNGNFAEVQTHI